MEVALDPADASTPKLKGRLEADLAQAKISFVVNNQNVSARALPATTATSRASTPGTTPSRRPAPGPGPDQGGSQSGAGGSSDDGSGAVAAVLACVLVLLLIAVVAILLIYHPKGRALWDKHGTVDKGPSKGEASRARSNSLRAMRNSLRGSPGVDQHAIEMNAKLMASLPVPTLHVGAVKPGSDPNLRLMYLNNVKQTLRAKMQVLLTEIESEGKTSRYTELRQVGLGQPQHAALREVNRIKNRYLNIIPYDHSRVHLPIEHDDPDTDYINANWIQGYGGDRTYIATQGPVPNSFISFWRMIWHEKVEVIVMVTNEWERGRQKCHRYWPENANRTSGATLSYGQNITVRHRDTTQHALWVTRAFEITNGGETRTVQQIAYTAWPDHGVPNETKELLLLRTMVRATMRDPLVPVVVHCSAGVGRTGTFIAVDRCIEQCLDLGGDGNALVNVDAIVHDMRQARNQMVQTEEQYMCIHSAVLDAVSWLLEKEEAAGRGSPARAAGFTDGLSLATPTGDSSELRVASVRRENPAYAPDTPTGEGLQKVSTLRLEDGDKLAGMSTSPTGTAESPPRNLSFVRGSSQKRKQTRRLAALPGFLFGAVGPLPRLQDQLWARARAARRLTPLSAQRTTFTFALALTAAPRPCPLSCGARVLPRHRVRRRTQRPDQHRLHDGAPQRGGRWVWRHHGGARDRSRVRRRPYVYGCRPSCALT